MKNKEAERKRKYETEGEASLQSADHNGAEEQSEMFEDEMKYYALEKKGGEKRSKLTPKESNECEIIVGDSASAVPGEMLLTKQAYESNLELLADTISGLRS